MYGRSLFQTPVLFCRSSDSDTGSGTLKAVSEASASATRKGSGLEFKQCERNVCRNNGTCIGVKQTVASTLCEDSSVAFNGTCYKFVVQKRSWYEANSFCQDISSQLVRIDSPDKREFVASLLWRLIQRMSMKDVDEEIFVWGAGIHLSGSERGQWLWNNSDSGSKMNRNVMFWKAHEPAETETENASHTGVACSDESVTFECAKSSGKEPLGIYLEYALFGRWTDFDEAAVRCGGDRFKEACTADNSLSLIRYLCNGLAICRLPKLDDLFFDSPCFVISNGL
ncbi:unnamed protein product, partial [Soboliphyme baturini]|uniref:C-type lectin domain-containing protein n=1 Tax=Soboliphyme baturini TaxID=241478 RepID=A0A183IUA3_9BILA